MPDSHASKAPLRVALCGYGFAGRTFHAPLIQAAPGLVLAVVASSRPEAVAADLPAVEVVADAASAFHRADLAVLAGPHHTHAALAHDAIGHGLHVVVDKPMSLSADEGRAMAAAAAARGLVLSVFHNRRWDGDFLTIRRLAASGTLGAIVHLESRFDRFRPQVRDRWRERAGPDGGLWFDLGPHLVDQALQLFGVPDRVTASLARQRPGAETDDWAHVVLDFGQRRAVLHASLVAAAAPPRFVVHGSAGSFVKQGLDVQERQLLDGVRPGHPEWGLDAAPAVKTDGEGRAHVVALERGAWETFYPRVAQAIHGGRNPVPPEQAVAVMAVIDAVFAAAGGSGVVEPRFTPAEREAMAAAALCP